MARNRELNPSIAHTTKVEGALHILKLLSRGVPSSAIVTQRRKTEAKGRKSEVRAMQLIAKLPYVTQIQDHPALTDTQFARRIDSIVQLSNRVIGAVYLQVKSSSHGVKRYYEKAQRVNSLERQDAVLKLLQSDKIIVLNVHTTRSNAEIIADFENQLAAIEEYWKCRQT